MSKTGRVHSRWLAGPAATRWSAAAAARASTPGAEVLHPKNLAKGSPPAIATTAATAASVRALPERAVLLHIGVPKTGTTMLQDAVAAAAPALAEHGVLYPAGQGPAALSVLEQRPPWMPAGAGPVGGHHWRVLGRQVRGASGRTFVTSEFLCEADARQVRRIVTGLGADRVHVLVTLRAFGRILPSAWQQYLKSGLTLDYESWLRAVLKEPPSAVVTPSFWRRHDHAAVVARWAAAVGPDRVTVVVTDEDRRLALRTVAGLLGVPGSLLDGGSEGHRVNRSMVAAEAELFRRVNARLKDSGRRWGDYGHLIRFGAALRTVERAPLDLDAERVVTPDWAARVAAERGARYADDIAALGVRVVGDLGRLGEDVTATPDERGAPVVPAGYVPVDAAVEAVLGTLSQAVHGNAFFDTADGSPDGLPVNRVGTAELVGVVGARVRRRVARALHR